jgi:branched-chain amino acid transport system ATP-binding protein
MNTLLEFEDVTMRFGGIVALDRLSFAVAENQIYGLIGPNGAGKSTAFNVVSRVYQPQDGSVTYRGMNLLDHTAHQIASLGIGRTFQNLAVFGSMTALENVVVGAHSAGSVGFGRAILRLGTKRENRALDARARRILAALGLGDIAHRHVSDLPFGTLKRLDLARALASEPNLLLLDEPASGLTHVEVEEFADVIRWIRAEFDLTIFLVEHHMGLVMSVSDRIVAMDHGQRLAEGTPEEVRNDPRVIEAYLGVDA